MAGDVRRWTIISPAGSNSENQRKPQVGPPLKLCPNLGIASLSKAQEDHH